MEQQTGNAGANEFRPWAFKVEGERTASGKDRVMVRGYGEDLDALSKQVMDKRDELLEQLGLPE